MPILRKVIFYLFLAIYLVATPLAILYALGYQVRPGQRQTLVRTGLISLGTTPDGARVFLGNSRYRWKTPTVLRDLKPGDYPIRLTLRDYQSWSGQIRVEAEKATVLDHLLLLPNQFTIRRTSTNRYQTLYPLPGGQTFLLSTGPLAGELAVCDAARATVQPLLPADDPFSGTRVRRLHQVADNPCLLMEVEHEGQRLYGWRRLDVEKEETLDITRLFPVEPDFLAWDQRERDDLFTLVDGQVNRLDLDDSALYPGVLKGVLSLAPHRGDLLILDHSNRIYRTSRDGERKPELLGKSPAEIETAWGSRRGYDLYPLNKDVVLFGSPEGELFVNREPYRLLKDGLRGVLPHPEDDVVLVWDKFRVGRYTYAAERERKAPPAQIHWLYESPHAIDQVFWCHEASHLLVAGQGELDLVALETAGGPAARPLIRYEPKTAVCYSERSGAAYYLEPDTRQLMELQLLPRRDLLNLNWRRTDHATAPTNSP